MNLRPEEVVLNIERYERNWHFFKSIILFIGIIIILSVQIYTFHKLLENSENNHLLICSIASYRNINTSEVMKRCN